MLISINHESSCKFWITPEMQKNLCALLWCNRKSHFWQQRLCSGNTMARKKIHLQHEQSISAANLANQRFLGNQKSEREMCDRSRKRWLGGPEGSHATKAT